MGGDDGQESRSQDGLGREGPVRDQGTGVELDELPAPAPVAFYGGLHADGPMMGELVQETGDGSGDSGPHEDDVHASQHGAVEGGGVRDLDLGQEVHAHLSGVALPGEEDLAERGQDRDGPTPGRAVDAPHGEESVGLALRKSSFHIPRIHDLLRHFQEREGRRCPAEVPTGIAVLEATDEEGVQPTPGDDAQLSSGRDGSGQAPAGNTDAHSTLDDSRQF